jgi:tetratricopeptide (TPR) repeat protein
MNVNRFFVVQASCLLALLALPASAGEEKKAAAKQEDEEFDLVVRTDKVPTPPIKITQDNYLEVIGKIGGRGVETKVPSCAIKEVIYADRDANYSAGLEKRDEGRYPLAALYFLKSLEAAKKEQKWVPEYCNYGIGSALYEAGFFKGYTGKSGNKYDPPSVYFQKVLTLNPKSRFLPDILVKLPICLAEEGKLDEAAAKLKESETKLKAYRDEAIRVHAGFNEIADKAAAELAIADARLAERKALASGGKGWDDVKEKWLSARFKCTKFPEAYADAVDGLMRSLIAMGKFNEAKAEAENIIGKYKTEGNPSQLPLLPGAWTVLGAANYSQAEQQLARGAVIQARTAYAEARWAFLNVVSQFFDNDEYVVRAHYFAGLCYDKLREVESDAGEKAVREWKLIVQNYPRSEFKDKAEKELARVGAK